VADPNRQPCDIAKESLEIWPATTEGTRARVVPWLEDTNDRAWDRPHPVREQIRGARDVDIDEWLMWDPSVSYTSDAYASRDRRSADPGWTAGSRAPVHPGAWPVGGPGRTSSPCRGAVPGA
jgi:hypothetical protein